MSFPELLTVAETAKLLRVSRMTVYRLVHSGELPAIQIGQGFRIPEQSLHDYIQGSEVVPDEGT
jgi:excisionase family DNA binding protein